MGILLLILINQTENTGISGNIILESFGILLCHPATKDIKWFLRLIIGCCLSLVVPMCACCQFTDIKVP